jgi:GntR family transcriptional regulator
MMSDNRAPRPQRSLPLAVRDDLLRFMDEQQLGPGDQAPTEAQASQMFGVSRSTAREALRLLEQDGVITVVHGRGRFLSAAGTLRVERPISKFESVTEMLEALGYEPKSAVLSVEQAPASAQEASDLSIAADDPVIRLFRLRFTDDEALIYSVDVIPRDFLPGPIAHRDWSGSLTTALAAQGHAIVSSVARLRAVNLPREVEDRYSLHDLGPWLLIEETCVSRSGQKVLYAQDYHRGDQMAFNVIRRR